MEVITGRVDVAFVCDSFLGGKKRKVTSGEITDRTWQELFKTSKLLTVAFGCDRLVSDLKGSDFDALRHSPRGGRAAIQLDWRSGDY